MRDMVLVTLIFIGVVGFAFKEIKNKPAKSSESTLLNWDDTIETINSKCDLELAKVQKTVDNIISLPPEQRSFQTVVANFELTSANFSEAVEPLMFYNSVSPDKKMRDASDACAKKVSKYFVDLFAKVELFNAFETVHKNIKNIPNSIDRKLVEEYYEDFIFNGMKLDEQSRNRLGVLNKELVDLNSEFSNVLNDWSNPLYLTRSELDGMPKSFIESLEKKDGRFILTLDYPHYYPFMNNGKNAEIRKKLQFAFMTRGGKENKERMIKAIKIRDEKAKLLGFQTHAHLKLLKKMAKTPEAVNEFLDRLQEGLTPKAQEELRQLAEIKQKELNLSELPTIEPWDWRYYSTQLVKQKYDIDPMEIQKYFPLDRVLAGMFDIYQSLLGVEFRLIPNAPVWHESVKMYAVYDPLLKTDVAYFYMDLFPRPGKYGHAAAFTLINGRQLENKKYRRPASSIVANFSAPSKSEPSLLPHNQVETLFHEFGHIMHQILTQAKYAYFSGTSVKRDFVEAPSQMLENWVWRKETLKKISSQYQTKEPLPDALLEKMLLAKNATSGLFYLRQLFFAKLDLAYHTTENFEGFDTSQIYRQMMKDIMLVGAPEDSYPEASFGHLMGGYDAGYYGYLWSEVYAQDMFTKFDKNGLLNQRAGHDYRRWILEPGGTKDPFDLIEGFLGRKPNEKAFLEDVGIN